MRESRLPDARIRFRDVRFQGAGYASFLGLNHPLDGSRTLFAHTDLTRVEFRNVAWIGPAPWQGRGRKAPIAIARAADEHLIGPMPGRRVSDPPPTTDHLDPSHVADIYRGLRRSYENSLRYPEAGAFHVREMEMRRIGKGAPAARRASEATKPWKRRAWSAWASVCRQVNGLNLYRWTSNYGEAYLRPALLLLLVWLPFAGWIPGSSWPADAAGAWFHGPHETGPGKFLAEWNGYALAGLAALPAQFAGDSGWSLFGRLGSAYLATVALIAVRRNFRRGGASGAD